MTSLHVLTLQYCVSVGAMVGARHEPVHAAGVVTWSVSVHSQSPLNESSNAAPVESPLHVLLARVSSPLRVSMPDDEPQTGQYEPGSVAEKRPIWSTMSAEVAVVWSVPAMSEIKSSPLK